MLDPGLPGVKIATNHIQLFNYARPIKFKKNTLRNHIFVSLGRIYYLLNIYSIVPIISNNLRHKQMKINGYVQKVQRDIYQT